MKAVLPAIAKPLLESRLPADLEIVWWRDAVEAEAAIGDAAIAWVDMHDKAAMVRVLEASGPALQWVSTIYAGLDTFPLGAIAARGAVLTNGTGINAAAVADYAVMGVLTGAKRLDQVVRAHDRHQWLREAPGTTELEGSRALIVGYGTIGRMIGDRLAAFGVAVTGVTRSGRAGTLTPDAWTARLGDFDWVILAAPSTDATKAMIGADELAAMKRGAWIINIARGDMIDDDALIAALNEGRIGGAFLDPTNPEPLPADHPLWSAPNCLVTMHLSGRSQTSMFARGADRFLANLARFQAGEPMDYAVDLDAGY